MALYDEGKLVEDFWSQDPKNVEAVFKTLAFSTLIGGFCHLIAGGPVHFPLGITPDTPRGTVAFLVGMYLLYLVFRFAHVALLDPFLKYREDKGRPVGKGAYWCLAALTVAFGQLVPTYLAFSAFSQSVK